MSHVTADNFFAVVPEWVILAASPRALQVYCLLRRYADHDTGETFVGLKTMGKRIGVSPDTISRAIAELEDLGAVSVEERFDEGRRTTNLYTVHATPRYPADMPPTPGRDAGGVPGNDAGEVPGKDAATLTKSQSATSQSTELAPRLSAAERANDAARRWDDLDEKGRHDGLVFSLVAACGWDDTAMTQPAWGRVHAAAKHLHDVGASPPDVARAAKVFVVKYPGAAVTPTGLSANWPDLMAGVQPRPTRRDIDHASTRAATRRAIEDLGR